MEVLKQGFLTVRDWLVVFWEWAKGKKTHTNSVAAIVYAIIAYKIDAVSSHEMLLIIFAALGFSAVRDGVERNK